MALVKIFDGDDAFEKANRFIDDRELSTAERFVTVKSDNFKYPGGPKVGGRIYWEEHSSSLLPIQFDGVPFQFVGRQIRECWKGPDRHQSDKLKSSRNKSESEHGYEEKSRKHSTKKEGCRASIILRAVICYPDYKIDSNSDYQKKVKRTLLNKALHSSNVNWGVRVYVSVPNESCHNHITGELSSVYQRLDQTIIDRIHSLVGDGVRRIDEMERAIFGYSKRQFPTANRLNSRFYPSRKIIKNHMYSALCVQQNVKQNLEWLSKNYSADILDIPDFLNCKSSAFIEHCMDRITIEPAVSEVNQTEEHTFTITSATSGCQYNIDLGGFLPSCTCLDWGKYHLPCKHMLHIIMHVPGHGWESLSEEFRNAPHLLVDEDVIPHHVQQDNQGTDGPKQTQSHSKVQPTHTPKQTVAVKSKCRALSCAINSMMYLVPADAQYEELFQDLTVLYKKVRGMVPAEAGIFRPRKPGRKLGQKNTSVLKLRKKRNKKTKTAEDVLSQLPPRWALEENQKRLVSETML